jgi:hypothetical protein
MKILGYITQDSIIGQGENLIGVCLIPEEYKYKQIKKLPFHTLCKNQKSITIKKLYTQNRIHKKTKPIV